MSPEDELHLGESHGCDVRPQNRKAPRPNAESRNGAVVRGRGAPRGGAPDQRRERKEEEEAATSPFSSRHWRGQLWTFSASTGKPSGRIRRIARGRARARPRERVSGQHRATRAPETDAPRGEGFERGRGLHERRHRSGGRFPSAPEERHDRCRGEDRRRGADEKAAETRRIAPAQADG